MQYLIGDALADKLLKAVKELSQVLLPVHEDAFEKLVQKAASGINKLSGLLLDESTPVDDQTFYSKFTTAKMETIRQTRASAKQSLQEGWYLNRPKCT